MPTLRPSLTALKQYRADEPVVLQFELANTSSHDILVLSWLTPLEGLRSDCLNVTHEGAPVAYDGPLVKRGQPSRNSFLLVPAGQSISAAFELSSAYPVTTPGEYEVRVATKVRGIPLPESEVALLGQLASFEREAERQWLESGPVTFAVHGDGNPWLTDGAHARLVEGQRASLRDLAEGKTSAEAMVSVPALLVAKEPKFTGGDASKKAVAKAAHFKAYDMFKASITKLANDADYLEWFGVHTATRFNKVKAAYSTTKGKMETKEFTYDLTGSSSDCDADTYAYTYRESATIWLCAKFWTCGTSGQDSQGGTVLHEHTHTSGGTDDKEYRPQPCRELAKNDPDTATVNADNYQYYAEGL